MPSMSSNTVNAPKKATNVSLTEQLLMEAKELQINISQAAEAGVTQAVAEKRAELWVKENAKAFFWVANPLRSARHPAV